MTQSRAVIRTLMFGPSLLLMAACATDTSSIDWDLRPRDQFSTAEAARSATAARPEPDARGIISYPGYQVAVARRGDTVETVAARVGVPAADLARQNAVAPNAPLNAGEVLAMPRRVAEPPPPAASAGGGAISVTTLASGAIDRADAGKPAAPQLPGGAEPLRHKVVRGETAFSIARLYSVPAKSLAEWNGLGADLAVREGQTLLIPVVIEDPSPPPAAATTVPGEGSPTPEPPSAAKPLPAENPAPANKPAPGTPASPNLGQDRTAASAARFAMPAQGAIIRGYVPKKSDGIDIGAPAGSTVKAAADGTVAAITKDTEQVPILVVRHADNILTVYANIDGIKVAKGDTVKRGQALAVVRQANPAFLHFEVRKGFEAVDPMPFLQ